MSIALNASSTTVFTQTNFENWIKLATDNKINASNSWDVALIDYFHDLSVLREGDGINFQKASTTLDGCVKIYTSRIDSAATETGRLLSGLAIGKDNEDDEEEDEEEKEGDGETVVKRHTRKQGSLLKSFQQLKIKKIDTEIIVDPLFRKTLTDFDEGGAKSLLMNMLRSIRAFFDDGMTLPPVKEKKSKRPIDLKSISNILNVDQTNLSICPSMDALKQVVAQDINSTKILEQLQKNGELEFDDELQEFEDMGLDFDNNESMAKNATSFDLSRIYAEDNTNNDGPNMTMVRLFNENFIEESAEASLLGEMDYNLMAYFDNLSKQSWAGPDHWKVKNVRLMLQQNDLQEINEQVAQKRDQLAKRNAKDSLVIDFFATDDDNDDETIFYKDRRTITIPRHRWKSDTYNILPEDQMFTTKNFIYLFLKSSRLINTVLFGRKSNSLPDSKDTDIVGPDYVNKSLANIINEDLQEIHDSFGDGGADWGFPDDQPDLPNAIGSQLASSTSRFKPNSINFARVAKRVDVKLLKDNLWDSFNKVKKEQIVDTEDPTLNFKDIVRDTGKKYNDEQRNDLSTSFCFICLLHLANENEFVIESNNDFSDLMIHQ